MTQTPTTNQSATGSATNKDGVLALKPKPLIISNSVPYPPGSGKAAKKARRRARKRLARVQAKAEAEEERRLDRARAEVDEAKLAEEKKARDKELYQRIKWENAQRAIAENEKNSNKIKTRSMATKLEEKKKVEWKALMEKTKKMQQEKKMKITDGGLKNGVKRKAAEDGDEESVPPRKKARDDEYVPSPDEDGFTDAVANAKAGKGKAGADEVDHGDQSKKRRRGDDDDVEDEDTDPTALNAKKVMVAHDQEDDADDNDDDDDDDDDLDSLFDGSIYDPIDALPNLGNEKPSLGTFPEELLERIIAHCDPISRTLLGLSNKRFGRLAVASDAGFPGIRDRYGGDLERHRFMQLLDSWMNRAYTQSPVPITVAQQTAREQLKQLRLCYICRKYLPINGKQCQYWKNCPKEKDMPVDPASQAARRAELERRRAITARVGGPSGYPRNLFNKPLPKVVKLKPKAQTFVWRDEDWSTLSVGLCKSRERIKDVKSICPKCTLTVHTVHLGWPPETPIVRWLNEGNPAGGRAAVGHMPPSGELFETEGEDGEDDEGDDEGAA